MAASLLQSRASHARSCLASLQEQWNSVDLDQLEACRELAAQAVLDLQKINEVLRQTGGYRNMDLYTELMHLKQDAARIARVSESGMAFFRGLEMRLGWQTGGYTASGQPVTQLQPPELDTVRV